MRPIPAALFTLLPTAGLTSQTPPDGRQLVVPASYRATAALGDVDGDGRPDLVIGRNGPFSVRRGLPNANERFAAEAPLGREVGVSCENAGQPHLCDIDRDGDLDLVALHTPLGGNGHVAWFANDGRGNFALPSALQFVGGGDMVCDGQTSAIAVGDWNGDGWLDVLSAHRTIRVHFGSSGGFAREPAELGVGTAGPMAVGDWNRDGGPDLLVVDEHHVVWYERVDGKLTAAGRIARVEGDAGQAQLSLADHDGDGALDVLLGEVTTRQTAPAAPLDAQDEARLASARRLVELVDREVGEMNRTPPPRGDAAAMRKRQDRREELLLWASAPRAVIEELTRQGQRRTYETAQRFVSGGK